MKLILKIFISVILITITVRVPVDACDISSIKEELVQIGLSQETSDNVIDYIDNLDITAEELQQVMEEGKNIYTLVGDKRSVKDFTITELYNLYNDATKIANDLNIDLKYDFKEKKATIKDKSTSNILFQGDPNELNTYYSNYIKIRCSNGEKSDLIVDIKDIINNKDTIYNQHNNNNNNNNNNHNNQDKLINVEETKQNDRSKKIRFRPIYYMIVIVVTLLIYVLFRKRHFHIH